MSGVTGWHAMGKPDFSQCAKLFYRLPAELREGMNRSEEKVVIWTIFLSWTTAFRSGRTGAIASFSEAWLGGRFGRSRWTVARALARLEEWSLLKRIRRTPKTDGTFQTNLIALSAKITALLGLVRSQVPDKSPCSKTAPQEMENEYKREKTAHSTGSASHSLSLSALRLREREDWERRNAERQQKEGTIVWEGLSLASCVQAFLQKKSAA
jgi:hypothetical protein